MSQSLCPEHERLVTLALVSREDFEEAEAFISELTEAVCRREITPEQATRLGAMVFSSPLDAWAAAL